MLLKLFKSKESIFAGGVSKNHVREQFSVIFPLLFDIDEIKIHADCIFQVGVDKNMKAEFLYADTLLSAAIPDENLVNYALMTCNAANLG